MLLKVYPDDMLINKMNISSLIILSQEIQEEKHKERCKEAKTDNGDFSPSRSDGLGRSRSDKRFFVKVPLMVWLQC